MSATASTPVATPAQTPLRELLEWLKSGLARCRAMRWFGAAFHLDVAGDIAAEVAQQHEKIARDAYAAEQSDLEAIKILEEAARDGLNACDMPAVAHAIRLVRASAVKDRQIAEVASV